MKRTPQERADWVVSTFGLRFTRLMAEAESLLDSDQSLRKRAKRMIEITDALAATVAPQAPACRKGCSYCCHQSVTITGYEAEAIAAVIGKAPAAVPPIESMEDIDALRNYTGIACPFLEQDRCSIYEVRPIACKTLFNMDDDETLCDMATHPGGTVPYFNFRKLQFLAGRLAWVEGDAVSDIRQFFPSGRK